MAEQIRHEYRLPALRFSMQFVKREPLVQIRAYLGREALAVESVPAAEIGITERLSVGAYRDAAFRLPRPTVRKLAAALSGCDVETLWLQIDRSAGFLAVVPWERLLAAEISWPILRIPNFLADPAFIEGRLELAVCASAPAAKEFYPVADFTISLVERIQQAVAQGTQIHLFSDADAFPALQARFPAEAMPGAHRVVVHPPDRARPFGTGGAEISQTQRLQSPWLRWMEAELAGRGIDAVHFICPGFFNSEHGSLALARSPLENRDEAWSHFVAGRELCTFLGALGAGAVALGAPYGDIWALGLRLLADELAWTRPGPVMLYEAQSPLDAVAQAYRFLFGENDAPPPGAGQLMLYCHPRRLERYADAPFFESPTLSTESPGHEWLQATRQQLARPAVRRHARTPEPGATPADEPGREQSPAPAAEPRWARANQLMIEQSLIDLSGRHGAVARGASNALRFLSDLQNQYVKE